MVSRQVANLPVELAQFREQQAPYSFGQQAAWRRIRLIGHNYFLKNAHPAYEASVKMLLIPVDTIPIISELDRILDKVEFGAIGVPGFIPPPAFVGLQSRGVMPISVDMRRPENLGYTPSPDITHEGLGHLAMMADPEYRRKIIQPFGRLGLIAGSTDLDQENYAAIENHCALKEDKDSTPDQLESAFEEVVRTEELLNRNPTAAKFVSRLYWQTVEYGLIKHEGRPKIYGAGIISSITESRRALAPDTKRIPLTVDVTGESYDITEPQKFYTVAESWEHVHNTIIELEARLRKEFKERLNDDPAQAYKAVRRPAGREKRRVLTAQEMELDAIYAGVRLAREEPRTTASNHLAELWGYKRRRFPKDWIAAMDILEELHRREALPRVQEEIRTFLRTEATEKENKDTLETIITDSLALLN